MWLHAALLVEICSSAFSLAVASPATRRHQMAGQLFFCGAALCIAITAAPKKMRISASQGVETDDVCSLEPMLSPSIPASSAVSSIWHSDSPAGFKC